MYFRNCGLQKTWLDKCLKSHVSEDPSTGNMKNKYTLLSRDNLMEPIQMHLSQKQKTFSEFFSAFFKSTSNFEHFQTKMTLIAYVFPNLRTPKDVVRSMSKKVPFQSTPWQSTW